MIPNLAFAIPPRENKRAELSLPLPALPLRVDDLLQFRIHENGSPILVLGFARLQPDKAILTINAFPGQVGAGIPPG
jgi:hypothetical protein